MGLALPASAQAHVLTDDGARAAAKAHADRVAGRSSEVYMLSQTGVFREGHAHSYYAQATWLIPGTADGKVTRYCFVEMRLNLPSARSTRAVVTGESAVCSPAEGSDSSAPNPE